MAFTPNKRIPEPNAIGLRGAREKVYPVLGEILVAVPFIEREALVTKPFID